MDLKSLADQFKNKLVRPYISAFSEMTEGSPDTDEDDITVDDEPDAAPDSDISDEAVDNAMLELLGTTGKEKRKKKYIDKLKAWYNKIFHMDLTTAYVPNRIGGGKHVSGKKAAYITLYTKIIPILLAGLITFALASGLFYLKSNGRVSAVMSLNYEKSNKGLYPNGARFNMSQFQSHDVMELAIKYAGISGLVTADELSKSLTITPIVTSDTDSAYFIATSFAISFNKPKQIKDITAEGMMNIIEKAYTDYFISNYATGINFSSFKVDTIDTDDVEYKQFASEVSTRIGQLKRLLSQRISEAPSYHSNNTDYNFSDLQQLLSNLESQQFDVYSSFITKRGVAKNKDKTISAYNYRNKQLTKARDKFQAEYDIRNEAVDIYERAIIESILVPTIDQDGSFYMSRTKIGIDDITSNAYDYLEQATYEQTCIDINQDYIDNITENYNEDYTELANKYASVVYDELNRVEKLVLTTDRDYMYEMTNSYLTFKYTANSIAERMNISKAAIIALLAMLIYFALAYGELTSRLKKMLEEENRLSLSKKSDTNKDEGQVADK